MTVIVAALTQDGTVTLASDTLISADDSPGTHVESKVWQHKGVLYAYAGDFIGAQAIRMAELPDAPTGDFESWGFRELIPRMREALSSAVAEGAELPDVTLLVGCTKGIAAVSVSQGFVRSTDMFIAEGDGAAYALGFLHSRHCMRVLTVKDAVGAVASAAKYSRICGGAASPLVMDRHGVVTEY